MIEPEIARLRRECDELREELRQVRELLKPVTSWQFLGISYVQSAIIGTLYERSPNVITCATLVLASAHACRNFLDGPEEKTIQVQVHKMRKKLPSEVVIVTVFGSGYSLPRTSKERMDELRRVYDSGDAIVDVPAFLPSKTSP